MQNSILRLVFRASAAAVLGLVASVANAVVITGSIENSGNSYSLIHAGSDPAPTDGPNDWLRFDDGEAFVFDLTGGIVTTLESQFYTLTSNNGASATLEIVNLFIDTNGSNGFASGQMDYVLNGVAGMFVGEDRLYGSSPFNSSQIVGGVFQAFMWAGDDFNDLGIDFSFSGPIPEPGTLLLLTVGLAGLGVARRRRRAQAGA